jgi:hypothetical protein
LAVGNTPTPVYQIKKYNCILIAGAFHPGGPEKGLFHKPGQPYSGS